MRTFRWLSAATIPGASDLRRCGWRLADASVAGVSLADAGGIDAPGWLELLQSEGSSARRSVLLLGVADSDERARLLRLGFGEVLGETPPLPELEARAQRVAEQRSHVPGVRRVGSLRLDLECRDARAGQSWLGLHPREFALLWRLAENPGQTVAKRVLIEDVWRLEFVPETNSLAVHIFRLRAKLADRGLAGVVVTDPGGGYRLVMPPARTPDAAERPALEGWHGGAPGVFAGGQTAEDQTHDA